jgi:hypothetical protein
VNSWHDEGTVQPARPSTSKKVQKSERFQLRQEVIKCDGEPLQNSPADSLFSAGQNSRRWWGCGRELHIYSKLAPRLSVMVINQFLT